jgi:hypothetical protein
MDKQRLNTRNAHYGISADRAFLSHYPSKPNPYGVKDAILASHLIGVLRKAGDDLPKRVANRGL